jgi:hypothetical protein
VSPQAQPQRRRPSSAQPVRRDPVPSRRVVQPEPKAVAVPVVVMAEDAAMAAARALATPPPTPAPTPAPVVPELPAGYGEGPASRTVSPALAQMLPLLRDRKGLRSAILLQEVFGSPLCRRRGRARRGLG